MDVQPDHDALDLNRNAPRALFLVLSKPKMASPTGPNFISGLIAGNNNFKAFHQWTQQYGPIVSAKIGTRTCINSGFKPLT